MPKPKTSKSKPSGQPRSMKVLLAVLIVAIVAITGILIIRFSQAAANVAQYNVAAPGLSQSVKDKINLNVLGMKADGSQDTSATFPQILYGINNTCQVGVTNVTVEGQPGYCNFIATNGSFSTDQAVNTPATVGTANGQVVKVPPRPTPAAGAPAVYDKTIWTAPAGNSTLALKDVGPAAGGQTGAFFYACFTVKTPSIQNTTTKVNLRLFSRSGPLTIGQPLPPETLLTEQLNISLSNTDYGYPNYYVNSFSPQVGNMVAYNYRPICIGYELGNNQNLIIRPTIELLNINPAQGPTRVGGMVAYTINNPVPPPPVPSYPLTWPVKATMKGGGGLPSRISQCWGGPNGPSYTGDNSQNNRPGGLHPGLDLPLPTGTPIYAAANGVVESAADVGDGYGKRVIIRHPATGLWTVYAHLDSINVSTGANINQGDKIGSAGNTGLSGGAHLHFIVQNVGGRATGSADMQPGGSSLVNLNPLNYLPAGVINETGCKRT